MFSAKPSFPHPITVAFLLDSEQYKVVFYEQRHQRKILMQNLYKSSRVFHRFGDLSGPNLFQWAGQNYIFQESGLLV